jgi:pimeloyl-ACP methyl ester carboxylesterase
MNENGHSVYPLFTETDDSVIEEVFGGNLYKSFISDLRDWKESGQISDYRAVPYDWRLDLHDVLKTTNIDGRISPNPSGTYRDGYIYQSLVALSEASPDGKVVLVGHSNGGLVIQTLLATMKANNDPLLGAVDKVILVAVPQVGTPESVVGMLHGVDIGIAGVAVSGEQSRKLINTAPFGYHLLPSAGYYDKVATPIITIEEGTSTNQWISQFGNKLDSLEEVTTFLTKESGRSTPNWENTSMPATAYSELLHYSDNAHNFVSDWKPAGTSVYEVAGTGINTPVTINYSSDFACLRSEIITGGVTHCLEYGTKLGYRVSEVIDGDGTVVTPSALATSAGEGVEKWWLDLKSYNLFRFDTVHKNIFEVSEISEFISDIISSSTLDSYTYLATSSPEFTDEDRLLLRLHSPLDLHIILEDGEVIGSSTPIIRGVEYRRYGEVQQLSVPDNEQNYQIRLSGVATGSFTLDMEEYSGDNLNNRTIYSAIPSSTSTEVILSIEDMDSLEELYLQIDYEGDGLFEAMALPGISQIFTNTTITPDTIDKRSTSGTKVKNRILTSVPESELVVGTINISERELMLQLIDLLTQYRDLLIKIQ